MTAFGRGEVKNKKGRFSVEIQCVNRKYLEVAPSLPRQFSLFEPGIRKVIGGKIARGKVSVYVNVELNPETVTLVRANTGLAKAIHRAYNEMAEELGFKKEVELSHILRNREVIEYVQRLDKVEQFWIPIKKAIEKALRETEKMKVAEGKAICEDFAGRLETMRKALFRTKRNSKRAVTKYRKRLIQRIKELSNGVLDKDDKVLREVAIYADRTDITEEITRLQSHLKQFEGYEKSNKPVGRTLDFLVQEMHREANTIASKSSDIQITKDIVIIKSELEKIREQVQNIK